MVWRKGYSSDVFPGNNYCFPTIDGLTYRQKELRCGKDVRCVLAWHSSFVCTSQGVKDISAMAMITVP